MLQDLQKIFGSLGAEFFQPLTVLSRKQLACRAYLLDWDGVFNNGHKQSTTAGSPFSEVDAMGLNMLRFSSYLRQDRIPQMGIVTGELNPAAMTLALRDHYDWVFFKINHKVKALDWLNTEQKLNDHHVGFFLDDVLDLGVAARANLRLAINHTAMPLFKEMLKQRNYADYVSGHNGDNHGIREICELLIQFNGNYNETMERRIRFAGEYEKFLTRRNETTTRFLTLKDGEVVEVSKEEVQAIVKV